MNDVYRFDYDDKYRIVVYSTFYRLMDVESVIALTYNSILGVMTLSQKVDGKLTEISRKFLEEDMCEER